jgi:glucose dehydrogenase/mono/diheme cytochrome c family protein
MLYFTTGNAAPDNNGSGRKGKNLFTASMIALDYRTGKLRWAYQMVHHDIWDYDAPSPTVLFDAKVDGKSVHGIGQAEKTGWVYLLNRETGQPLLPTPERSVPQNAKQKTWPTQPTPTYAPVVRHAPTQQQFKQVTAAAKEAAGSPVKTIKATQIFTPYWDTMTVFTPGPQGGTNWQPSSYNPKTHLMYVCAQSGAAGATAGEIGPKQKGGIQQLNIGGTLAVAGGFGSNEGTFSALDVTTGRIVWQKVWPESCYAGSTTTAGDIVFIGRSDGRLLAFNAQDGTQLWSFQVGAGANNAPTVFKHDGKEEVAFYAAGNALAASPHGDNLWLFSLDGTLHQVPAPSPGAGIQHAGEGGGEKKPPTAGAGNAAAGKTVFAENCSTCHGATGHGGNGGPDLTTIPSAKQLQTVINQVTNGGAGMPSFKGTLTEQQIRDVSTYVVSEITHGSTK